MIERAKTTKLSEALGLSKTYDPAGTENRWQKAWEEKGAFKPDPAAPGDPFSVVIPPPNVTGSLHMGHAFNTALIDTVVRYKSSFFFPSLLPAIFSPNWIVCFRKP